VRRKRVTAGVAACLALAVLLVWVLAPQHRPAAVAVPPAPAPTAPTTAPPPTPKPRPKPPVAPAAPTAFSLTGPAVQIDARVCGMPNIRPLDPPGDQFHTVCWVDEGFGVAPGSRSAGTTYVLGHAWAEANLVLNQLSIFALNHVDRAHPQVEGGVSTYPVRALDGYRLALRTPNGTLVYRVRRAFTVAKDQAGLVPSIMAEKVRNRIVLITCAVHDGADVDENVLVYAYLTDWAKA
jgi:hypothetical protein